MTSLRGATSPILIALVTLSFGLSPALGQSIIYVDAAAAGARNGTSWLDAYTSVVAAMTVAQPDDQVWVAAGEYVGQVSLKSGVALYGGFDGSEASLEQRDWQTHRTILTTRNWGSVVVARSLLTATARVDGFVITQGSGSLVGSTPCGGGLLIESDLVVIANNTISDNEADVGGGIYSRECSPIITGNRIISNDGEGIFCYEGSPVIQANVINSNRGAAVVLNLTESVVDQNEIVGNEGVGVSAFGSTLSITRNHIRQNAAGVSLSWTSAVISNNRIVQNRGVGASIDGESVIVNNLFSANGSGGVSCKKATIINNTFHANFNASTSGAIYCGGGNVLAANNIIAFNSSGIRGHASVSLHNNCLFGNTGGDFSGMPTPPPAQGNIYIDPRLVTARHGNAHLRPDSPCRDAGSPLYIEPGWTDMDEDPRVLGSQVDIGADEFSGVTWPAEDPVIRVRPEGDDQLDGATWPRAKATISAAIAALDSTGGEIWVQEGQYGEDLDVPPFIYLYGGFAGTENNRAERNWRDNPTQLLAPVEVSAGHQVSCLDGFIIRGSVVGITCRSGAPSLTHNVILDCSSNAIYCEFAAPVISDSVLAYNRGYSGAAIYAWEGAPRIVNCTIVHNQSTYGLAAIEVYSPPSPVVIANSIVAFNSAGVTVSWGNATLRHNCVYGNSVFEYSGIADPTGTQGNISVDPRLARSPFGDVHLLPGSPCNDAADIASLVPGARDMDGMDRVAGTAPDIGADEFDGTLWPSGAPVIVRVQPEGDDAQDGSSWPHAKRTVQAGIDTAAPTGGEVWVSEGTFAERISIPAGVFLYGGFAGVEVERGQRDWQARTSILDGLHGGPVVTVSESAFRVCGLDGFTVKNGMGAPYPYGGGIRCTNTGPSLANNIIRENQASYGAGVYAENGVLELLNNRIEENVASWIGGGVYVDGALQARGNAIAFNTASWGGGGMWIWGPAFLDSNLVHGNSATHQSGKGGGIYWYDFSRNGSLTGNLILNNVAASGGGLHVDAYDWTIANNVFAGNRASAKGGAAQIYSGGKGLFTNNTLVGNGSPATGGALYCYATTVTLANSIVAFNASGVLAHSGTLTMRSLDVHGNQGPAYAGVTDPTGTNFNIASDPRFRRAPHPGPDGNWATADDDYGELHLARGSPCIEAGWNQHAVGKVDIGGCRRIADGILYRWPAVDIGAYEYQQSDFDGDCDVDRDDYAWWASCLTGPGLSVSPDCAEADRDGDGDVDLLDFHRFAERFAFWSRSGPPEVRPIVYP